MSTKSKLDAAMSSEGTERDADIETHGIADAMAQLGDAVPALLQLHSALLAGLHRSQQREAERLASREEDDPHAAAARSRADKFERLFSSFGKIGSGMGKIAEGQAQPGLFHGFVMVEGGNPAADFTVKLEMPGSRALKTRTDDTGYFRIALADAPTRKRGAAQAGERAAARPPEFDPLSAKEEPEAGLATIENPSGRVVMREAVRLLADSSQSLLQFYALPAGSSNSRKARKA